MSHTRIRFATSHALALALAACGDTQPTGGQPATLGRSGDGRAGLHRQYGTPVPVGDGRARAYVVYDETAGGAPIEIGVALDERALQGLPAATSHQGGAAAGEHDHPDKNAYLLSLPARGAAPFQFVELDWNPGGHEPPGIYDVPHFDFHFWTTSQAERASIVPGTPEYQRRAEMLPPEAQRAPFYVVPGPPAAVAVPLMGVHWSDVRSPELQRMPGGDPGKYRPFTTTFIYGSWAGRFVFLEPMITRAHILAKRSATDPAARDEVIPISVPAQVGAPGHYPSAYRIMWDAQAREYRIALTNLSRR